MATPTKELYEKKLYAATKIRQYLIFPCLLITMAASLFSISMGDKSSAILNLGMTAFNLFNLWSNGKLCDLYQRVIDTCDNVSQAQRIKDLNPHGR